MKVVLEKSWQMFSLVWKMLLHICGRLTSATVSFCNIAIYLMYTCLRLDGRIATAIL